MTTTTHAVPRQRFTPYSKHHSLLLSPDAVEILLRSGRNIRFERELTARRRASQLGVSLASLACLVSFLDLALVLHG